MLFWEDMIVLLVCLKYYCFMSLLNFCFESYGFEHSCHNKEITWTSMLGSIPHQKFCFYHLPTLGQAGIKLGDAWYISNVSIIFDCSMLLYYYSCMFLDLAYVWLDLVNLIVFPLLCSSCSWGFPLQFVEDLHLGFHPTTLTPIRPRVGKW